MVDQRTQFADLEEYLFKLVQEETDSLASCSNTPMVTEKSKTSKPYAHIKEDVKYEDVIDTIPHDPEDRPQSLVH